MIHLPANLEPVGNILKATVSSTSIGSFIVTLLNDKQTFNIKDTLQKHQKQLDMLREIVIGELHVNRERYIEELKTALQKAKDEANEEKRRLYASYLTACCHPDNFEQRSRRIFLELVEKIDFTSVQILKDLTTHFNGREAVEHFSRVFKDILSMNDIMIQLDYLTSHRVIEQCSQEEIDMFYKRYRNVRTRRTIAPRTMLYYKRTVLGDNLYKFISKGIV